MTTYRRRTRGEKAETSCVTSADGRHDSSVSDLPAAEEEAALNDSDSVTEVKEAHVVVIVKAEEPEEAAEERAVKDIEEETAEEPIVVKVKEAEAETANNEKRSIAAEEQIVVKVKSENDYYAESKNEAIVKSIVIRTESVEGRTPSICFDNILESSDKKKKKLILKILSGMKKMMMPLS